MSRKCNNYHRIRDLCDYTNAEKAMLRLVISRQFEIKDKLKIIGKEFSENENVIIQLGQ